MITKAQWATPDQTTTVNVFYDDGAQLAVPATEDNRHYKELLTWEARGNKIDAYVAPTEIDGVADLSAAKSIVEASVRYSAHGLLSPTDWVVVRETETGVSPSPEISAFRTAVREKSEQKIGAISSAATLEALKTFLRSEDYTDWPKI